MIETLLFLVALAVLGFIVGVGVLFYQETEWVRNFMHKHPVFAWPMVFVGFGVAWYAVMYALFVAMLAVVSLLLGHQTAPMSQ